LGALLINTVQVVFFLLHVGKAALQLGEAPGVCLLAPHHFSGGVASIVPGSSDEH
jgi:hypothetical protein